jgi:DNA-binding MarR family transcriptional regulator
MSLKNQQQFSIIMTRFVQKIMALDRAEKVCHGVTLSQAYTIGTIYDKKMLTMNELSQELGLAISTLTRIIDVLVRDEIVCRYHCEEDRRKVNICLTDKGKELAKKLWNCSLKYWSNIYNLIPNDMKHEMTNHLKILLKALQETEETCCHKNS